MIEERFLIGGNVCLPRTVRSEIKREGFGNLGKGAREGWPAVPAHAVPYHTVQVSMYVW